jgi:hypothetical protein
LLRSIPHCDFNNDAEAFAVQNALTMEQKLKVK